MSLPAIPSLLLFGSTDSGHSYKVRSFLQHVGQPSEWQGILEWLSWETKRVGFSVPNRQGGANQAAFSTRTTSAQGEALHPEDQRP